MEWTYITIRSSLQSGKTALMMASKNGHDEVVRMLVSAGAQVNLQDKVINI